MLQPSSKNTNDNGGGVKPQGKGTSSKPRQSPTSRIRQQHKDKGLSHANQDDDEENAKKSQPQPQLSEPSELQRLQNEAAAAAAQEQQQQQQQQQQQSPQYQVHDKVYARDEDGLLYLGVIRRSLYGRMGIRTCRLGYISLQESEDGARRESPDAQCWQHLVHFDGWNSKWDRWVLQDNIYPHDHVVVDAYAKRLVQEHKQLMASFRQQRRHHKSTSLSNFDSAGFLRAWREVVDRVDAEYQMPNPQLDLYRGLVDVRCTQVPTSLRQLLVPEHNQMPPSQRTPAKSTSSSSSSKNLGKKSVSNNKKKTKNNNNNNNNDDEGSSLPPPRKRPRGGGGGGGILTLEQEYALRQTSLTKWQPSQPSPQKQLPQAPALPSMVLPQPLRQVLVDQWEIICQCHMVSTLPAPITVRQALQQYIQSKGVGGGDSGGRNEEEEPPPPPNRIPTKGVPTGAAATTTDDDEAKPLTTKMTTTTQGATTTNTVDDNDNDTKPSTTTKMTATTTTRIQSVEKGNLNEHDDKDDDDDDKFDDHRKPAALPSSSIRAAFENPPQQEEEEHQQPQQTPEVSRNGCSPMAAEAATNTIEKKKKHIWADAATTATTMTPTMSMETTISTRLPEENNGQDLINTMTVAPSLLRNGIQKDECMSLLSPSVSQQYHHHHHEDDNRRTRLELAAAKAAAPSAETTTNGRKALLSSEMLLLCNAKNGQTTMTMTAGNESGGDENENEDGLRIRRQGLLELTKERLPWTPKEASQEARNLFPSRPVPDPILLEVVNSCHLAADPAIVHEAVAPLLERKTTSHPPCNGTKTKTPNGSKEGEEEEKNKNNSKNDSTPPSTTIAATTNDCAAQPATNDTANRSNTTTSNACDKQDPLNGHLDSAAAIVDANNEDLTASSASALTVQVPVVETKGAESGFSNDDDDNEKDKDEAKLPSKDEGNHASALAVQVPVVETKGAESGCSNDDDDNEKDKDKLPSKEDEGNQVGSSSPTTTSKRSRKLPTRSSSPPASSLPPPPPPRRLSSKTPTAKKTTKRKRGRPPKNKSSEVHGSNNNKNSYNKRRRKNGTVDESHNNGEEKQPSHAINGSHDMGLAAAARGGGAVAAAAAPHGETLGSTIINKKDYDSTNDVQQQPNSSTNDMDNGNGCCEDLERQKQQHQDWIDMADGLAMFFDEALEKHLLYREEHKQLSVIRTNPAFRGMAYSDLYGPEYLLRLFLRLPQVLSDSNIPPSEVRLIMAKINDLVRFLNKNQAKLFPLKHERP
ncbi:hypothetical protein ACA910_009487 [Epithemia clementina (nom. ined.)]